MNKLEKLILLGQHCFATCMLPNAPGFNLTVAAFGNFTGVENTLRRLKEKKVGSYINLTESSLQKGRRLFIQNLPINLIFISLSPARRASRDRSPCSGAQPILSDVVDASEINSKISQFFSMIFPMILSR